MVSGGPQSSSKEVKFADVLKFKLLAEVEKYPALWERNSEEFKNKQAKSTMWSKWQRQRQGIQRMELGER
ncbi:hypothetical protein AAVH_16544 [Aphelenchoides avenae]|nr:hypothetical protein AAVH_16544 [Aphelenchus avenae]